MQGSIRKNFQHKKAIGSAVKRPKPGSRIARGNRFCTYPLGAGGAKQALQADLRLAAAGRPFRRLPALNAGIEMVFGQVGDFAEVGKLFFRRKGAAALFAHRHGKLGFPDRAHSCLVFHGNDVDRADVGAGAAGDAVGRRLVKGRNNQCGFCPGL